MTLHLVGVDLPPHTIGGVASWTADAASAIAGAGEPVVLYGRRQGRTSEWDEARPHPVVRMRGRAWVQRQALWAVLTVGPRLRRGDRLLCATWTVAHALVPLARSLGIPIAIAAHGSELTQHATPPPALQGVGPHVHWLPVSRFLADELDRLGGSEWPRTIAPMPLSIPPLRNHDGRSGLVCVARHTPLKGLDRAARLAARLGERLVIIGSPDGPDGTDARGPLSRAETRSLLTQARAAVLLPRTTPDGRGAEGLGLALLEAAAHGTPVIGCRTGGVPEAVGPGLLLDDADDPDPDVVQEWLDDPDRGPAAHQWVRSHHGPLRFLAAVDEAWS